MSASPRISPLRRALVAAAEALADFLEAHAEERPAAPTEPAPPVPNNDLAERFAREQLRRNGWPEPPRGRRAG